MTIILLPFALGLWMCWLVRLHEIYIKSFNVALFTDSMNYHKHVRHVTVYAHQHVVPWAISIDFLENDNCVMLGETNRTAINLFKQLSPKFHRHFDRNRTIKSMNLNSLVIFSYGAFNYYVSMFLEFIEPPTYLCKDIFSP